MNQEKATAYQNHQYISDQSSLQDCCQRLLKTAEINWIAIDTEFVRVDTYFPELSLVQIADNQGQLFIIDPLEIAADAAYLNVTSAAHATQAHPLWPLIEVLKSNHLLKVFHSARQDIEVLYQLAGEMPQNIFDTQIAAIFKGYGDLSGFARVIEAELDEKLAKSQTRTNWHARPLTKEQIHYALDDVYYLAKLYQQFANSLSEDQKNAVFEDCQTLLQTSLYEINPAEAWHRIKGIKGFKPKQLAILQSLVQWREIKAIEDNEPRKWIASDEVLVQVCKRPPKTTQALYKVPGIKASTVKSYGDVWIELIDEVFRLDPKDYPKPPAKLDAASVQEEIVLQLLLALCQQVALDNQITATNISNKQTLLEFIRGNSTAVFGWRKQLFYQTASELLNNQCQLAIENGHLHCSPNIKI